MGRVQFPVETARAAVFDERDHGVSEVGGEQEVSLAAEAAGYGWPFCGRMELGRPVGPSGSLATLERMESAADRRGDRERGDSMTLYREAGRCSRPMTRRRDSNTAKIRLRTGLRFHADCQVSG